MCGITCYVSNMILYVIGTGLGGLASDAGVFGKDEHMVNTPMRTSMQITLSAPSDSELAREAHPQGIYLYTPPL